MRAASGPFWQHLGYSYDKNSWSKQEHMTYKNFRNASGRGGARENLMGIFIVGLLWDGILRSSFSPLWDPGGVGLVAEAGRPLRHPQLVEVDVQGLRLVPQVDLEVLPGVLQHSELVPRCLRLVFQPSPEKGRFTTQSIVTSYQEMFHRRLF